MRERTGSNIYGQMYGEVIPLDKLTDQQWAILLKRYKKSSSAWHKVYGPKPGDHGCVVPIRLQAATDAEIDDLVARFREDNRRSDYG